MKNNSNKLLNNQKGFTFIELILYVSIFVMMLATIIPFSWDVIGSSRKSATQQEVNSQARYISERIKYEIRNAKDLNFVLGGALISLKTSTPATDPTIIGFSDNNIIIMQGPGSPQIKLNSDNTIVTNRSFTNYTSIDNKTKNIQFKFTLNSAFGSQNQIYKASTTIESDAEIRSN